MSGAERLKEKIIAEAEAHAEQVLNEARQRASELTERGEKEAMLRRETLLTEARIQAEEKKRRTLTLAELDARKEILAAKEELIENTFTHALSRLQELDQVAYLESIFPMILASVQHGDEEIIASYGQRDYYDSSFLGELNEALRGQGKKGELTIAAETRPLRGGFVLRAGEVEINNSFDSRLRMQRDVLEPAVAEMLFTE
ncbi:MAG TPA: V-type ATP synthase subunit E family protein [Candidatus Limnocylindrales bacterium]|nr:V-type ATP synthase subunit E family protein [Candidatus Limnocylindrales bacterium]